LERGEALLTTTIGEVRGEIVFGVVAWNLAAGEKTAALALPVHLAEQADAGCRVGEKRAEGFLPSLRDWQLFAWRCRG